MTLRGSRILVTGATGFVGRALVRALEADGADVHILSRKRSQRRNAHHANLRDADAVLGIVSRIEPEIVFHLGGAVTGERSLDTVAETFADNTMGTVNLLTAATRVGVPRVVVAGSMEEPAIGSTDPPLHPYAASKTAASLYARMFASLFELPVVTRNEYKPYHSSPTSRHTPGSAGFTSKPTNPWLVWLMAQSTYTGVSDWPLMGLAPPLTCDPL